MALTEEVQDWQNSASTSAADDFTYTLSFAAANNGPLSLDVNSHACSNGACKVGSRIIVEGDMTLYQELTSTVCVYLVRNLNNGATSNSVTGTADLCEAFNIQSIDGSSTCPEPGNYTFQAEVSVTTLSAGASMHVEETIYDCSGQENLRIVVEADVTSTQQSMWSYYCASIGALSLLVADGGFWYHQRRKRRLATSIGTMEQTDCHQQAPQSDFEMMYNT
ncbi:MAG: hypothetical protein AAFR36_32900 [Bacteroidota bacterium]